MILYVNTTADPCNSSAKLVEGLRSYARSISETTILAAGRGNPDIKIGGGADFLIHTLRSRLTGREGEGSRNATLRLIRELDRHPIKTVHLHNLHGHYLNIDIFSDYLSEREVKTVLTLHDCWWMTGRCATFIHHGCQPSAEVCSHCRWKNEYPKALISDAVRNLENKRKWLGRLPGLTIAGVSEWVTEAAKKYLRTDAEYITIPNGTDTGFFRPTLAKESGLILAVAANWEPWKRLDYLERIAARLAGEAKIAVIGNLMGQRLPKGTIYLGKNFSPSQMRDFYSRASLLIAPSTGETFGLTLLESMACGTPVIANSGGASFREILSAGKGGTLVDFSNPEAVANEIRASLSCKKKFAPRSLVEQKFSIVEMSRRYFEIYGYSTGLGFGASSGV